MTIMFRVKPPSDLELEYWSSIREERERIPQFFVVLLQHRLFDLSGTPVIDFSNTRTTSDAPPENPGWTVRDIIDSGLRHLNWRIPSSTNLDEVTSAADDLLSYTKKFHPEEVNKNNTEFELFLECLPLHVNMVSGTNVSFIKVHEIMRSVIQKVILPHFEKLKADLVPEKSAGDRTSVADTEAEKSAGDWTSVASTVAEQELAKQLSQLLPGSIVAGKESMAEDQSLSALLSQSAPVWLVTAIDGKECFRAGEPRFGMMVALVVEGCTTGAWIVASVSGRYAIAARGKGCWHDGKKIVAADQTGTLTGTMAGREVESYRGGIEKAGHWVADANCVGSEYLGILSGKHHFFLHSGTNVWDHAAGALLVREAGGKSSLLDGSDYEPGRPGGIILSACGLSAWKKLQELPAET